MDFSVPAATMSMLLFFFPDERTDASPEEVCDIMKLAIRDLCQRKNMIKFVGNSKSYISK